MKENNIKLPKWRNLDNSAKIFPLSSSRKYSTVFRISALLKDAVNPNILKQALEKALEKYDFFKVKMKKGFFWHYLETNPLNPIVEKESDYPCKYIDPIENNGYLFKVTYLKNKINIDIFHALTDGNSGISFLKEILYTYLEMCYPNELKKDSRTFRRLDYSTEDSYLKNYDKRAKPSKTGKRAYKIKGRKLNSGEVNVTHQIINLEQLKNEVKKYDVTVTQYLTAVLFYSIYKQNYIKNNGKRPIKICIPVNLKKYFPSKTVSNFFSYITLVGEMNKNKLTAFEKILEFVKAEFKSQLTEEEILKTMSNNVKLGTHIFIKPIPLFLKILIVRLAYIEIRRHTTITYSNMGRIGIIGDYQKYIDKFLILISPEQFERIKCSSCTFENNIVFTFTSLLKNNSIETGFYDFLTEKGIDIKFKTENHFYINS